MFGDDVVGDDVVGDVVLCDMLCAGTFICTPIFLKVVCCAVFANSSQLLFSAFFFPFLSFSFLFFSFPFFTFVSLSIPFYPFLSFSILIPITTLSFAPLCSFLFSPGLHPAAFAPCVSPLCSLSMRVDVAPLSSGEQK